HRDPRIETVDAPIKAGDFTEVIERLILTGRPVVLAVDEAADRRLVLSLDGRRVLRPWAAFVKPDGQRQIALYAVAGDGGWGYGADASAPDGDKGAAQHGLGVSLWMQGRREEAVRSLAEALRLDGQDLRAGFNLNVARNA